MILHHVRINIVNLHCVVHKPFCVYHFVVEARISMRFWLIMHGKIPRWSHESGHSVCCWCYSSCFLHILEIIIIYKWISSIIIIIFYIYWTVDRPEMRNPLDFLSRCWRRDKRRPAPDFRATWRRRVSNVSSRPCRWRVCDAEPPSWWLMRPN